MKEIKETTNYEMFKFLRGNRDINTKRVQKIIKSIMEVGYITSPILVNENMEIIDGQGRFEALRYLRLPVEYIVHPGINIKECIAMNIYQSNWVLQDYIKSYVDKGIESYVLLDSLMREFPQIKRLETFAVAIWGMNSMDTIKTRTGTLEITETEYAAAKEKLEYIYPIIEKYNKIPRIGLLTNGMIHCLNVEGIDKKLLKEKVIEMLETDKIPPIPTMDDCMQSLETLYNKYKRGRTLFIYTEYRKIIEERKLAGINVINGK